MSLIPRREGKYRAPFRGSVYDIFNDFLSDQWLSSLNTSEKMNQIAPRTDIAETKDGYHMAIEMPGVKESDVDINLKDDILTVKGERASEKEVEEKNYYCLERSRGSFERSIKLPESADPDKIEASFKDGLLEITIPKIGEKPSTPKKIPIGKR